MPVQAIITTDTILIPEITLRIIPGQYVMVVRRKMKRILQPWVIPNIASVFTVRWKNAACLKQITCTTKEKI